MPAAKDHQIELLQAQEAPTPPKGDEHELAMRVIDEAHLEMLYADARKISDELRRRTGGSVVGRRLTFDPRFRVQTSGPL